MPLLRLRISDACHAAVAGALCAIDASMSRMLRAFTFSAALFDYAAAADAAAHIRRRRFLPLYARILLCCLPDILCAMHAKSRV